MIALAILFERGVAHKYDWESVPAKGWLRCSKPCCCLSAKLICFEVVPETCTGMPTPDRDRLFLQYRQHRSLSIPISSSCNFSSQKAQQEEVCTTSKSLDTVQGGNVRTTGTTLQWQKLNAQYTCSLAIQVSQAMLHLALPSSFKPHEALSSISWESIAAYYSLQGMTHSVCLGLRAPSSYAVFVDSSCSFISASIPFRTSRSMLSAKLLNSDSADCCTSPFNGAVAVVGLLLIHWSARTSLACIWAVRSLLAVCNLRMVS